MNDREDSPLPKPPNTPFGRDKWGLYREAEQQGPMLAADKMAMAAVQGRLEEGHLLARGHKIQGKKLAKRLTWRQLLELDGCARCGECMLWCPVYDQDRRECITARGKLKALKGILNETISEPDQEDFLKSLYECSACGQCHMVYPMRINTPELWEQAREALVSAGIPQPEGQVRQIETIKSFDNSFSRPKTERGLRAQRA